MPCRQPKGRHGDLRTAGHLLLWLSRQSGSPCSQVLSDGGRVELGGRVHGFCQALPGRRKTAESGAWWFERRHGQNLALWGSSRRGGAAAGRRRAGAVNGWDFRDFQRATAIQYRDHGHSSRRAACADRSESGKYGLARCGRHRFDQVRERMRSAKQQEIMATLGLPAGALVVSLLVFGMFVAGSGTNPFTAYTLMYTGGFGTWFSWQNTLQRAAPLILTALCTAIPAHLGLVIIGGEGAVVLGGLGAVVMALHLPGGTPWLVQLAMALAGMVAGGLLILVAGALRHYRGVNETISSLLLTYIAIAVFNHLVEGLLRDPASLNKPSTMPIGEANMLGHLPGLDVHWGLGFGVIFCVAMYVLVARTTVGF